MSTRAIGPRRPAVAALFTLLLAGLGHLYAGRLRRGLVFLALDAIWGCVAMQTLVRVRTGGTNLAVAVSLYWAFRLYVGFDAARGATHAGDGHRWFDRLLVAFDTRVAGSPGDGRRRWFQRWHVYVLSLLLLGWAHLLIVFRVTVRNFHMTARSMEQTLARGDMFLVDRFAYGVPVPFGDGDLVRYADPARGDVVVYRTVAEDGSVQYLGFRVLGLPGEEIEIRDDQLHVDGRPLHEPYVNLEGLRQSDFGPVMVPASSFFVLGDSRLRANDSRTARTRFVGRAEIVGRAATILFSHDPATGPPRWERVGQVVR